MFEMPEAGLSVDEAVTKFKASQDTDSPVEQPETNDVVNVSEDTPPEEAEEVVEAETEESVHEASEQATNDDEAGDLFYDVDGEEVSASTIKEWKSGSMMQSDYTRKTQAHAEEVKQFNIDKESLNTKQQQLDVALAEFEAINGEEAISAEDLADLREYEPEKYIEHIEKKQKRAKLIADSKGLASKKGTDFQQEYSAFAQSQDGWLENSQPTAKATADIAVMTKYADANGYTNDDLSGFTSRNFKTLLDAAKYNEGKSKADVMTKKVRKAPPITKPRQQAKTTLQTEIDVAQAKFKQSGKVDDAVKLARLKRQLNN